MDSLKNKIENIEITEIIRALGESRWIMAKAARKLGITKRMIGYKIKKYGGEIKKSQHFGINDTHQTNKEETQ